MVRFCDKDVITLNYDGILKAGASGDVFKGLPVYK